MEESREKYYYMIIFPYIYTMDSLHWDIRSWWYAVHIPALSVQHESHYLMTRPRLRLTGVGKWGLSEIPCLGVVAACGTTILLALIAVDASNGDYDASMMVQEKNRDKKYI